MTIPFNERISCTVAEACDSTGLGRTTVYELIKEGRIETRKIGKRTLILVPSLRAMMSTGRVAQATA